MSSTNAVAETVDAKTALPEIARLMRKLHMEAAAAVQEDGPNVAMQIMERILATESEEELFEAQDAGTVSTKDYVDRPFRLTSAGIVWKKARESYVQQGGFPFYALLNVTDLETGETVPLVGGGSTFVAVIAKLQELDGFARYDAEGGRPLVIKSHPTGNGDYAWLSVHPYKILVPATPGAKK